MLSHLTLILIIILIYMMWMDIMFYQDIQFTDIRKMDNNSSDFSPFKPLTVKLMMLSPTVQYLEDPLAFLVVQRTNVVDLMTPNMVSGTGVLVAAVAAVLFLSSNYQNRLLGVVLFKVRDFLDSLDGNVARELNNSQSGQIPDPSSTGYYVDGYCDSDADIFRFIAFIFLLEQALQKKGYILTNYIHYKIVNTKRDLYLAADSKISRFKLPCLIVMSISLQSLISAVLWNYLMLNYHTLLETQNPDDNHPDLESFMFRQNQALKSPSMWMICYFWRILNPQAITQMQLVGLLYVKEVDLLLFCQFLGFLPIFLLGVASFIHIEYIKYMIM